MTARLASLLISFLATAASVPAPVASSKPSPSELPALCRKVGATPLKADAVERRIFLGGIITAEQRAIFELLAAEISGALVLLLLFCV